MYNINTQQHNKFNENQQYFNIQKDILQNIRHSVLPNRVGQSQKSHYQNHHTPNSYQQVQSYAATFSPNSHNLNPLVSTSSANISKSEMKNNQSNIEINNKAANNDF